MCYRIFMKPTHSHDWLRVSEHSSLQEVLGILDSLSHDHVAAPGTYVGRNIRGELIAKVTVGTWPAPSTVTPLAHLLVS